MNRENDKKDTLEKILENTTILVERTRQNQILSWLDKHTKARQVVYIFCIAFIADKSEDVIEVVMHIIGQLLT